MTTYVCVQKFRDNNGLIRGYKLKSSIGSHLNIDAERLKYLISNNQIKVENLGLTTDNRLVESKKIGTKTKTNDAYYIIYCKDKHGNGFITEWSLNRNSAMTHLTKDLRLAAKLNRDEAERCYDYYSSGWEGKKEVSAFSCRDHDIKYANKAIKEMKKIASELKINMTYDYFNTIYKNGFIGFNFNIGQDCLVVLFVSEDSGHLLLDAHNNRGDHITEAFSFSDVRLMELRAEILKLKY